MATSRFLSLINGILTMVVPATSSAGSASAGQIVALNASGQVDSTMMPAGTGATTASILTSAALTASSPLVNIWDNSGVANARPADSTSAGSEANGFVLASVSSGSNATVYGPGEIISGLSGLTPGSIYYLGTAGALTLTPPSTVGNVVQNVGRAVSATSFLFQPQLPVTVA